MLASALLLTLVAACAQIPSGQEANNNNPDYRELRSPPVQLAASHASTPPLTLMAVPRRDTNPEHEVKRIPRRHTTQSLTARDPVVQSTAVTILSPTVALSFEGVGQGFTGPSGTFNLTGAPPDTNGDVGLNHYVQTVNQDLMVWNKSGTKLYGPVPINTLFQSLGGLCAADNDGDPVVLYDQAADRWFVSQFAVTNPDPNYHQCVAVSQNGDPTGSYFTYDFTYPAFNDYGKAGVWTDAYYFTYNMFAGGTTFAGAKICAFDRARMLTGASATQQCFDTSTSYGGVLAADIDGTTLPAAGEPAFVLGLGLGTNDLAFWKFHVDWNTPANSTFSGPTVINVPSYGAACNGGTCIPQAGTSQQLDSLADRMMYRLQWRQTADGVEHLVTNHSVTAGSSTGVRWYEIRSPNTSPTLFQAGTYAPDANYRWMGSAAMDASGGIGLGFSVSSSGAHPAIAVTGRNASDSPGVMGQGETTVKIGGGSQTATLSRWGDYSNLSVDPVDGCTFWYTTEYIPSNGTFNWHTTVANFKLSGCGAVVTNDFSINASPSTVSVVRGSSVTSTISTATTSGAAQNVSFSTSGLPSGATASFNPGSVTSGGSSTLTIFTTTGTATGSYAVTVTGTGATATHATTVTLTVTAPVANDFSISASPSSVSVAQGGAGNSTISTTITSGSAQTVNLSASGLPSGASASFSPASVSSGGNSTLTLSASASTTPGTYPITVTGTGSSATHSTSVSLTVTSVTTGGGITNGGFETGNFTGWVQSGAFSAVVSGGHSGSFSAQVGSTSPTNGDSSIAQTFTAPSAGGTLTFWYKVVCPDTITYDWATATLRDNTASTTTTVLAQVCSNTGTWQQSAGAALAGGHSYTLTLTSHDDNYPGDPTYTFYDDVVISGAAPPPPPPPPPPPNPIVNGGFESGTLSGWTPGGAATSVVSGGHSGSYSARLGTTVPTNGDSSIAQTFTAPSGSSKVTFWYKVSCPDTITYDWATATLRDNTTATTGTVLARTCTNSGTWVQASGTVTAGHSYTLTLTSHDDNYSSDPTYTLYDDVVVQ